MKKKAQAGMEAMIAIGVIFVLFLGTYLMYMAKNSDVVRSQQQLNEREDCFKVANGITNAFTLGDSTIKATIYHELTVYPAEQRIETANAFCTFPLKAVYDSALTLNSFTLQPGKITIENSEGMITLRNA
ncbi:hypothetical protein HY497_01225 [Candidatus Woesearchaeota archaeon]|nr:hypothetical protein [Candidatus Woesearchaeota archaeon]